MDKFAMKIMPKKLEEMGVFKIICVNETINESGCGFDIFLEYKGFLYWDYLFIAKNYKDIDTGYLLDKIKEEIELTKEKVDIFFKRDERYKSEGKYNATEIYEFINSEIGYVRDVLYPEDEVHNNDKYNVNYIKERLKANKSPLKILNEARIDFKEDMRREDLIEEEMGEFIIKKEAW